MEMGMSAEAYLKGWEKKVEKEIERLVPQEGQPSAIYEAMRYSLFAGGKRLRPVLCISGCEAVGEKPAIVLPAACAIECIHTYSLIHDDLPAMDNDDIRRGLPTSHKVFGEAMAILAGDALLTKAFECMTDEGMARTVGPDGLVKAIQLLSEAAGASGMVGGQLLDIQGGGRIQNSKELKEIHDRKTGALIRAAVVIGGLLGGGSPTQIEGLSSYGEKVGLAFQIVDDILDVEGNAAVLGKSTGSDASQEKTTYPSLHGLELSKEMALAALDEAIAALCVFSDGSPLLTSLARFVVLRRH